MGRILLAVNNEWAIALIKQKDGNSQLRKTTFLKIPDVHKYIKEYKPEQTILHEDDENGDLVISMTDMYKYIEVQIINLKTRKAYIVNTRVGANYRALQLILHEDVIYVVAQKIDD